jgi:hypothetical protein
MRAPRAAGYRRSVVRPLPKYITLHTSGSFDIRITRHGVQYRARARTLERALQLVEKFIATAGDGRVSNTGIPGICESVHWICNKPYPVFYVSAWEGYHRRFTFKRCGGRRQALLAAAAHRAQLTGQPITEAQIEEALNHV